ncbi:hypothetical protein EKK58_01940 [Candidatus Dependentiae bacterium]|nr:MAG: hypothetical protein EKK58_01940 [Candidatus Dependentiae bacterium]
MSTQKKGFMLLEVVIGTMIASAISIILMNALGQMTTISQQVDQMHETSFQLIMIHHQFERDIMGMCVPLQGVVKEEQKSSTTATNQNEQKQTDAKNAAPKQKHIPKIFFAAMSDTQQMQQVTFITNNPLPKYWQGQVGNASPKIVRIVYYLQPSKYNNQSFALMRQESADLASTAFGTETNSKAYAVADHIQSFSLTFSYQTIKEGSPKTSAPKTESAQVHSWNSDELLEQAKQPNAKKYSSLLPYSITISGALWNNSFTKTVPFSLTIPILSNGFNTAIMYEPKKDEKKQANQPQAPQQKEKAPSLEITSMKDAIKALGGPADGNIVITSDSSFAMPSFLQAPVVHIPFDSIILGSS